MTPQYLVPLTLVAILIGVFNSFGGLTSIGISLERENFEYLRSLPIDFKRYLFMKFWLLYLVQSILPVILLVGVCLYFGVHPLAILAMLLIWVVTTIPICIRDYAKDFQNFSTNWTDIHRVDDPSSWECSPSVYSLDCLSLCDVPLDYCQLHLDLSFRQHPASRDPL